MSDLIIANTFATDLITTALVDAGVILLGSKIELFEFNQDLSCDTQYDWPGSSHTIIGQPSCTLYLKSDSFLSTGEGDYYNLLTLALKNIFKASEINVVGMSTSFDGSSYTYEINFYMYNTNNDHLKPPHPPAPISELDMNLFSIKSISKRKIKT